jgi:hypothetical protein
VQGVGRVATVLDAVRDEFVEAPDLQRMYIMDNGGPNSYRIIYLDGRSFPENIPPTNYGYSIGHWEGDTLVVETRGLNEKFWMDTRGTPHTAQLKFTERFTRSDMNTMHYTATIDDPAPIRRHGRRTISRCGGGPGDELFEYICQQANQGPTLMLGSQESWTTRASLCLKNMRITHLRSRLCLVVAAAVLIGGQSLGPGGTSARRHLVR